MKSLWMNLTKLISRMFRKKQKTEDFNPFGNSSNDWDQYNDNVSF